MTEPVFSNPADPHSPEGLDVQVVELADGTASIQGPDLHNLFKRLATWGAGGGIASARFTISTDEGEFSGCAVTLVALPREIQVGFLAGPGSPTDD